jgi:hypothetical protein
MRDSNPFRRPRYYRYFNPLRTKKIASCSGTPNLRIGYGPATKVTGGAGPAKQPSQQNRAIKVSPPMTDLDRLADLVQRVAAEVATVSLAGIDHAKKAANCIKKAEQRNAFKNAVKAALSNSQEEFNIPATTPRFNGQAEDGNPIAFLFKHYRKKIERGNFYQSDLAVLDRKLADCLKNVFKSRNWSFTVSDAVEVLQRDGLPTMIRGRELSTVQNYCEILPGRRNIRLKADAGGSPEADRSSDQSLQRDARNRLQHAIA